MSVTEPLMPARAPLPMDDAVGRVALGKALWRLIPLLGMMRFQASVVIGPGHGK